LTPDTPSAHPPLRVAVAASGGRDSTALLHATLRSARSLGIQVFALHVHHGLMPQADSWLAHLRRQCQRWGRAGRPVTLVSRQLAGAPAQGESVEAWARRERYAALAAMAHEVGAGLVLLAHHQRDQAETVLLQALRGAGPAGLAAMPRLAVRQGLVWARPWLAQPDSAIADHVRRWRLTHVDDPSNDDPRFARSRVRRQVWPALSAAFPDAGHSLAAVAARAQEADAALAELGAADLAQICPSPDRAWMDVPAWRLLSPARRRWALRVWLGARLPGGVPQTLIDRLADELPGAHVARWPAGAAHEVALYRGRLQLRSVGPAPSGAATPSEPGAPEPVDLRQPGVYRFPHWQGALAVHAVSADGIAAAALACAELRTRSGGETFQRHPQSAVRRLKKQFQQAGIPAWQRAAPLVFAAGRLVYVPGLGLDARAILPLPAESHGSLRQLEWIPDPAD
jgi:tRNA(Ile)-lysidine synthase